MLRGIRIKARRKVYDEHSEPVYLEVELDYEYDETAFPSLWNEAKEALADGEKVFKQ